MYKECKIKLINAGFTILRACDYPEPCIKSNIDGYSWKVYKKFPTKAARNREISRIRNEESKMIFDSPDI